MAEHVLTRKIGPLPTWEWVAIAGGGIALWAVYKNRTSGAGSSGSGASSGALQGPYVIQTTPPDQSINVGQDDDDDKKKTHRKHQVRPKRVSVPNVVGQEYPKAGAAVKQAGLTAQRSSPFVGKVTRESPHAGTKVKKGSVVTLSGKPWPQSPPPAGGGGGQPPKQHSGGGNGRKPRGSR